MLEEDGAQFSFGTRLSENNCQRAIAQSIGLNDFSHEFVLRNDINRQSCLFYNILRSKMMNSVSNRKMIAAG